MARCARDQGWEGVEVGPQNSISVDSLPTEQRDAFHDVLAACEQEAGSQPGAVPLSRADLGAVYRSQLQSKKCLEGMGFSISDPPSENVFIDSYYGDGGPWLPHAELPADADWSEVTATCPQP